MTADSNIPMKSAVIAAPLNGVFDRGGAVLRLDDDTQSVGHMRHDVGGGDASAAVEDHSGWTS